MKISRRTAIVCFGQLLLSLSAAAQDAAVRQAFSTPVIVERSAPVTSVPLDVRGGKLHLAASLAGVEAEFIFDTGSPTILTSEFADQLDLEVIGQNTGVDANGTAVTMDVAIVDEIAIGDVIFRKTPVLIYDFAETPLAACFFDGGVIGSELLPGSAWRIDLERQQLSIASSAGELGAAAEADHAPLYDFGYPHMPVVDYAVKDFTDKALFDTGNAGTVVVFKDIARDRDVRRAIARGSMRRGRGTQGVSAGGMGTQVDLQRFSLTDARVGEAQLAPIGAGTRQTPPTLIGAGVLDRYIVTLDYPAGAMLWEPRAAQELKAPYQGFGVMFVENVAMVVQLFKDTPADRAGLRLGDHVLNISGRSLAAQNDAQRCAQARWLAGLSDRAPPTTITVLRNGEALELRLD